MADGLLGPGGVLDPATPIEGLGLLSDVGVPGPFARGVKSGVAGVKSSLYGAGALAARGAANILPAAVAPIATGLEHAALENVAAQNEIAAAQSMQYEDVVKDPTRVGEYFKWLLGNAAPSLAIMAAGGGLGALAGRAVASQASIAAARAAGVVTPAVRTGAFMGAVAPDVALEAGSIYPEALKTGVENPALRAAGGGALAASMDFIPLLAAEKYLKPIGKGGFGAMSRGAAKGVPIGAGLEGSQEMTQSLIERAAAGKSLTDPEAISDYINSFLGGAAPGALFGGVIGARRQSAAPVTIDNSTGLPVDTSPQVPTVSASAETPVAGETIPDLGTSVPDLGTPDPVALHAAATEQMARAEVQTAAAQTAHDALVARRDELTAEAKLPIGERRTKSEITVEKKAVGKQIAEAKAQLETIGGTLNTARQTVAGLAAQLDPAAAAMRAQGVDIAPVPAAATAPAPTIEEVTQRAVEGARVAAGEPVGQATQKDRIANATLPDIKELVLAKLTGQGENLIAGISSKVERAVTAALALPTVAERAAAIRKNVPKAFANKIAKGDAQDFAEQRAKEVEAGTLYSRGAVQEAQANSLGVVKKLRAAGLDKDAILAHPEYQQAKATEAAVVQQDTQDTANAETARTSLDGFENTFAPAQKAKVVAALTGEQHRVNQSFQTRRDFIRSAITEGAKVGEAEGGRALVWPDGRYMRQKDITKTALDYAEFLQANPHQSNAALTQDEFDVLDEPAQFAAVDEFNRIMRARGTALRQEIARMLGPRAGLIMKTFMAAPDSPIGSYTRVDTLKSVITMALNALDGLSVAAHEGYHAAEDLVLTKSEIQIITNALKEGRPLRNQLIARLQQYDRENKTNLTDEVSAIPQEARAYAYEFWKRGELKADGPLLRVFRILQQFFERIANSVRGLGFTSMEDIFTALDRGQFAERESNSGLFSEGAVNSRSADYLQSPAFKKWFGDSKVVDAEGKPLVVYHGTANDVSTFDPSRSGENYPKTGGKLGFFFTASPSQASTYALAHASASMGQPAIPGLFAGTSADAGHGGSNVVPVYLSLQNPLLHRLREDAAWHPDVQFDRAKERLYAKAAKEGRDGVIVTNYIGANGEDQTLYIAFRPEQIKSAIGNVGTFDPNNPDIRFSTAGEQGWFRSALTTAIAALPTKAASVQGWKDQIKGLVGKNDVKQVEIDAVGLNEFLDLQQGKVSKDSVMAFLGENGVRVEETHLGAMGDGHMELDERARAMFGKAYDYLELDQAQAVREAQEDSGVPNLAPKFGPDTHPTMSLPGGPLSRDTEILTREGWVRMDAVSVGDEVMTRRDEDGGLEWQPVEAVPTVHADKLYHFANQSINMRVTPCHKMVVKRRRRSSQGLFRVTAQELWNMAECSVPLTGIWIGEELSELYGRSAVDVAELIGWYIAEGSAVKSPTGHKSTLSIAQSQEANPEKCARLEALFARLGIKWNYVASGPAYFLSTKTMPRDLVALLHAQGNAENKYVPGFLLNARPVVLQAILDGLLLGDGHLSEKTGRKPRWTYFTKSKQLADDVQLLALLTGKRGMVAQRPDGLYVVALNDKAWASIDDAKRAIVEYNDTAYCVTVKNHSIYVRTNGVAAFTGNSNYRELLLTLPTTNDIIHFHPDEVAITEPRNRDIWVARMGEHQLNIPRVQAPTVFEAQIYAADRFSQEENAAKNRKETFRSSHFDQPNILAHIRFNERTDAEGKRVLFIEEIQSDWAQKGKKEGFNQENKPLTKANLAIVLRENGFNSTSDDFGYLLDTIYSQAKNGPDVLEDSLKVDLGIGATQARRIADAFRGKGLTSGVPSAPFVTKTEAWVGLSLKRMIRYAAENGFDKVAWTTGEQQAERYDLSKQVDKIEWMPHVGTTKQQIDLNVKNGGQISFTVDKGKVVAEVLHATGLLGKSLDEVVGKEVAKKIEESHKGKLSGEGLKIGGEGMKAFYDKIVPNVANEVLRKLGGGRVEQVKFTGERFKVVKDANSWGYEDDAGGGEGGFPTREDAQAAANSDNRRETVKVGEQPGFAITPELATRAANGIPLFSRAGIDPLIPPALRTLYSKAAIQAERQIKTQMEAGELEQLQSNRVLTRFMEDANSVPWQQKLKQVGLKPEVVGTKGALSRWWNDYMSTPNFISASSKGFANVYRTLNNYLRFRDTLVEKMLKERIPDWYKASFANQDAAFGALLKRTVEKYKVGSIEYQDLMRTLTPEQKNLFDQATNMVAGFLDAELAVDTVDFKRFLTSEGSYDKWLAARIEQVQEMKDTGYIPLRRYGDHTVRISKTITDKEGATQQVTVALEMFRHEDQAVLAEGIYKAEAARQGLTYTIERGMKQKNARENSPSIQQFLDTLRRQGVDISQAERERLVLTMTNSESMVRNRLLHREGIPGFSKDGERVLNEFGMNMASKIAYARFGSAIDAAAEGRAVNSDVDADGNPTIEIDYRATAEDGTQEPVDEYKARNLWAVDGPMSGYYYDRAAKLSDAVLVPDHSGVWSRNLRSAGMMYFIGGSISSAVVNVMSIPMLLVPQMSVHTNYANGLSTAMGAWKSTWQHQAILRDITRLKNLDRDPKNDMPGIDNVPGLRVALIAAADKLQDTELHQIMGISQGQMFAQSRTIRRAMDVWMAPFRITEQTNRITSFIAGYKVGQENGLKNQELFNFARSMVDSTQNNYTTANRPGIANTPIGGLLFMFRSFPLFMIEAAVLMHKANPRSAIYMLLGLTMMTGVQGLPFAETLLNLIDTISQRIFGSSFNVRRAMRNVLKDASEATIGYDLSELAMRGMINEILGISMSSRIGAGDFVPGSRLGTADADQGKILSQILGPSYAMIHDALTNVGGAVSGIATGDWKKTADALRAGGPVAIRNAIKGLEQLDTGYASNSKGQVIKDVNTVSALLQMTGLSSAGVAKAYELESIKIQVMAFHDEFAQNLQVQLVKAIRAGDAEKVQEIADLRSAWNRENPSLQIMPNAAATRRAVVLSGMNWNRRDEMMLSRRNRGAFTDLLGEQQ